MKQISSRLDLITAISFHFLIIANHISRGLFVIRFHSDIFHINNHEYRLYLWKTDNRDMWIFHFIFMLFPGAKYFTQVRWVLRKNISAIQYLVPNCIFYMSQSIPIFQHVLRQTSRIFRDIQYLLLGLAESTYNLFKHSPMYWPHSPTERNAIRREVELKNELRRWRLTPGSEFQDEFLHQISLQ